MTYQLDKLIGQIKKLPTINAVAFQVIQLCSDSDTSISQLVKVISVDQSLTSQVLRIANSSYFNYPRKITTLERAIVILGFNLLRDIAVSIAIYSLYKGFSAQSGVDLGAQWRHSITTAFTGRAIAEKLDPAAKEVLYIAGLLHDLGKLVELRLLPEEFPMLVEKSRQEGLRLDVVERRLLGFHHGDVGAALLERWNLPEKLHQSTRYHHYPEEFEGDPAVAGLVRQVYLANVVSHYLEGEQPGMEAVVAYDPDFTRYFSFSEEEFLGLVDYAQELIAQNQAFFDIIGS
ncbi:MAG: HDOD domain-containing protein [Calditrichaeota bacterium]|nr:MAG: HDOD domain-containing protein [Calditrichota bacterium]